jgi:Cu/Ag efflux pump CusA
MRHPVTTLVLAVGLISAGGLAAYRMRVDIFPSLNTPKIYVFLQYSGMRPEQMEGFVACQFELLFQYVEGIKEIKSRSIQNVALVEISFYPGTDMGPTSAQLAERCLRSNSYPALKSISCEFQNGTLILRGCVATYYLKQVAQAAVARLESVERIDNQIRVVTPPSRRD